MLEIFEQYDKRGNQRVLRLKETIYGLCQSPGSFCKFLTNKLTANVMLQYNPDPCIYIVNKVICIVYADDLIFWARDKSEIRDLAIQIHDIGVDL